MARRPKGETAMMRSGPRVAIPLQARVEDENSKRKYREKDIVRWEGRSGGRETE